MAKIQIAASKLENPTVTFISLVERGANRTPFKILKEAENGMINLDLSKLFSTKKAETKTPALVGFVVEKNDDLDAAKEIIKKAGFSVEKAVEREDGTVAFLQGETEPKLEDCLIIKMSDALVAVMDGVDTATLLKDTPIEAIHKEHGYVPDALSAMTFLQKAMSDTLMKGEAEEIAKMEETMAGVHRYVAASKGLLPSSVYRMNDELVVAKAASAYAKADPKGGGVTAGGSTTGGKGVPSGGSGFDGKPPAANTTGSITGGKVPAGLVRKDGDPEGNDGEDPPAKKEEPPTKEEMAALAATAVAEGVKPVTDMLAGVQKSFKETMEGFAASMTTQAALVAETVQKVEAATKVAKAAEAALKGTVLGGPPPTDNAVGRGAQVKKDDDPRTGLFDTAYLPRSQRNRVVKQYGR